MKKPILYASMLIFCLSGILLFVHLKNENLDTTPAKAPSDWAFLQRAFPYGEINHEA